MNRLINILAILLLFVCIFDPENLVFEMKSIVFFGLVALTAVELARKSKLSIDRDLINYITSFLLIVTFSVIVLLFRDVAVWSNFGWVSYSKTFLFLLLTIVLSYNNINLIIPLRNMLNILSMITIVIFITVNGFPDLLEPIQHYGNDVGVFGISFRKYADFSFNNVYFHTAPLMIFNVTYYSYKLFVKGEKRALVWVLITICAMIFSGTRNNMILSLAAFSFYFFNANRKYLLLLVPLLFYFLAAYSDLISAMFDSKDVSNEVRLSYLSDYGRELSNIWTLIFGQGLGSEFYVSTHDEYVSNTELTYLEIYRRFGMLMGTGVIFLLVYPIIKFFKNISYRWLILAYTLYLIMIITNPFFFSSNGIILLSIVLLIDEYEEL